MARCSSSCFIAVARPFAQNADVDVRRLQIGRDVDLVHGDERVFESDIARDEAAQFAFQRVRSRGGVDVSLAESSGMR